MDKARSHKPEYLVSNASFKDYSVPRVPLSLSETIDLPLRLILIAPISILFNVVRCLFLAWSGGLPLRLYVACGVIRVLFRHLSPRQMQLLAPSTLQIYRSWIPLRSARARMMRETAVKGRLREDIEPLPDGRSSIMWLGDRHKADRFVLFFHGGGYVSWLTQGHLEWCLQAYILADEKVEVAVAVLQYTMCPAAQYPVQLQQASAALAHLLSSGIDPGQIVVGGDSAGGNLTAQLLGHILHPHPSVEPIRLAKPLRAAFTVSPWVSTSINTPSFRENRHIDMLSPEISLRSSRTLLEGTGYEAEERKGYGWAMPVDAEDTWFDGLSKATKALDQGLVFADRILRRNKDVRVTLEVGESEAHDFILLEGMENFVGEATVRMRNWFSGVISDE
ncbi:alpha/beta-hydrolase [Coniochaeta ligniaria NRRL 30616]|uniref:Alpha/beta-hydrolase n=1 Tax=Coniochaeta ligniaria NRRL 30616 TaxID=1408157 RepID=A0A1J7INK2_9PEZI|nr:alpha/beta-hydrolase [Coniochaeta ligniaria NRRL 30616]